MCLMLHWYYLIHFKVLNDPFNPVCVLHLLCFCFFCLFLYPLHQPIQRLEFLGQIKKNFFAIINVCAIVTGISKLVSSCISIKVSIWGANILSGFIFAYHPAAWVRVPSIPSTLISIIFTFCCICHMKRTKICPDCTSFLK